MHAVPLSELRKLRSQMVLKDLSLIDVSKLSGVAYTTCSLVLNGKVNFPDQFRRIKQVIREAPYPQEATIA
jgi:hypothetical protein